jgi:NAD(P)-dependent dehydrogenase (short-subunit alcohol dehydrogenase family)/acyl carrier protein
MREGGVYLLTGGFGKAGRIVALHLAERWGARLVLSSRSPLPARDTWDEWLGSQPEDDARSVKIRFLLDLEEAGTEVLTLQADVSDTAAMAEVMGRTLERFGELNGVFHLAAALGLEDGIQRPVAEAGVEASREQFAAKIHGAYVLADCLRQAEIRSNLDFCLLFSSISTVLGGLGFTIYSACNHFLDAFAQRQSQGGGPPWLAVDWDTWLSAGEAAQHVPGPAGSAANYFMHPEESAEALDRVLSLPSVPRIAAATGDLEDRLSRWVYRAASDEEEVAEDPGESFDRPTLHSTFRAPEGEIQTTIAEIWSSLLGISEIGVDDSFLELGGDSLLGIQLLSRLRDAFKVDLSPQDIFAAPTIAALAERIGGEEEDDELQLLEDLFENIEEMPDSAVQEAIADRETY